MGEPTQITEKGRVTIPKDLREKYDLEPDEIVWVDTGDGISLKKRTNTAGRGLLLPDGISTKKREEIADELCRRLRERRK